jgi:hypothetical protein
MRLVRRKLPDLRILFDQGTPVPLRRHLSSHEVATAFELGWSSITNGALLAEAEAQGFDILITTDRNLRYQQDLSSRRIAILVLTTTSWPRIQQALPEVAESVDRWVPGAYTEVLIP